MNHPSHAELEEFARQAATEELADAILQHLDLCQECSETVRDLELSSLRGLLPNLAELNSYTTESNANEVQCQRMIDAICDSRFNPIDAPEIPQEIGNYQLHAKIGEGGMGVVYSGTHTKLMREVAVKLIQLNRLLNPRAVDRFKREMIAAGRLRHPNIVLVMDAGEQSGLHYMVMEYLDGMDVSALCRTRRLAVPDICEIIRQAACGVHEAHRESLIHRDIKPSNLFLTRRSGNEEKPLVKLLDLGLARIESGSFSLSEVSLSGQVLGTLAYMAPEQLRDSTTVDHRVDIYSLGATMFKMLCGVSPFGFEKQHARDKSLLDFGRGRVSAIESVTEGLRKEVRDIVERAISQEPGDRFSSAAELAEALEPYSEGSNLEALFDRTGEDEAIEESALFDEQSLHTVSASSAGPMGTSQPRSRTSPAYFVALSLAVMILMIASGWLWFASRSKVPRAIDFARAVPVSELNSAYVDEVTFISADGRTMLVQTNRSDSILQLDNLSYQLFAASRQTDDAVFNVEDQSRLSGAYAGVFSVRSGILSPDLLEFFFFSHDEDDGGRMSFYRSLRSDIEQPFPAGEIVLEASLVPKGSGCYHSPQWMSPDGLRLYFTYENRDVSGNSVGNGDRKLYMIERPSREEPFGTPMEDFFAQLNEHKVESASLSADELELFFCSDRKGGQGGFDIWYADRQSKDEPFLNPINIKRINTEKDETSPRIFQDTLYFSRGVPSDLDVYMSTRGGQSDGGSKTAVVSPKYGNVRAIDSLNSDAHEAVMWVSQDELNICLSSKRLDPIQKEHSLFFASRTDVSKPFSTPDPYIFSELNDSEYNVANAVLSFDMLEIFYSAGSTPFGSDSFYRSRRQSLSEPFPAGELVMEASIARMGEKGNERPRWLSPDGKRLYFVFQQVRSERFHMFVIERDSIDSTFGKPTDSIFRNLNGRWNRLSIGSLSSDELQIYFQAADNDDVLSSNVYFASRERLDEPFANPVLVETLSTEGRETNSRLAGERIYFVREKDGKGDIYVADLLLDD